jgi:hypothetical protein
MMSNAVLIPDIDDERMASCSLYIQPASPLHSIYRNESSSNDPTWALQLIREGDGRCATCGLQTHCFRSDPCTRESVKIPLSIQNEVHRGRCLLCHPLPNSSIRQEGYEDTHFLTASHYVETNNLSVQSLPPITAAPLHEGTTPSIEEDLRCKISGSSAELDDILHAMKSCPHDGFIQDIGCAALWVHSWDDETSSVIGRVGGIDIILDAMIHFPNNSHLQRCACEALQNLSSNLYNRIRIVEHGGAALVVQAMMRHLYSLSIQQCGCSALAALAASPELRADILQAGGGLAISHSLRKFDHDMGFCVHASQALQTLGFAN